MSQTKTNEIKGFVATPPSNYIKKIINTEDSYPLSKTFTREQINRRIAFFKELNMIRIKLAREKKTYEKKFALYGWKDTSTVRVYMRETVSRIAKELFFSEYFISVNNIYISRSGGKKDKDTGYVTVIIKAELSEIEALLNYIKPGSSYYVYDGESSKYIPGNTEDSEFIITRTEDPEQPQKFWRRSQSFIERIEEL